MALTNGLRALTTAEEQQEIIVVNTRFVGGFTEKHHNEHCHIPHLRLLFAHWQSDFQGGKIPYWHVKSTGPNLDSTLSIEGLKQWGLI